jgi:gliding motility-associated-like protein
MPSVVCFAQLCNGSKGDTVVYKDFTRGRWLGDVESDPVKGMLPLFVHRTDYFCPPDYSYCITNHSYGCNAGSWFDVPYDHTANDSIGRFLLIAGSTTPAAFYQDTFSALKPNTGYELSFWFLNMYRKYNPPLCASIGNPVRPDLTLIAQTRNGNELARFRTGPLEETTDAQWKQLGLSFTMPAGETQVIIRVENNATGICGNDFAIDDWLIRECTPSNIKAGFKNSNVQGDTAVICFNNNSFVYLTEKSTPLYANGTYQWQESVDNGITWTDIADAMNNNLTRIIPEASTHLYRLSAGPANCFTNNCRVSSNILTVFTVPTPRNMVFSNSPICTGKNIELNAIGGLRYEWTGPNKFKQSGAAIVIPKATLEASGVYRIEISNAQCTAFDSVNVLVEPAPDVNAGPDKTITAGGSVQLNGRSTTPGAMYSWTPELYINNPNSLTPLVNPTEETLYKLTVTTPKGCGTVADSVLVRVLGNVTIPNTFTPNGDGINDTWIIKGLSSYQNSKVNVYNRYGQLVFTSNGYSIAWNGTINGRDLPVGTYYYTIQLSSNNSDLLKGSITIIR